MCPSFQRIIFQVSSIVVPRLSAHGCLELTDHKSGVGAYTEKLFVCITHVEVNPSVIKMGGGRLHRDGCLLGLLQYSCELFSKCSLPSI